MSSPTRTGRDSAEVRPDARGAPTEAPPRVAWAWVAVVAGVLLWSYWPVLVGLAKEWGQDDDYSVGALVLPAALYMAWLDRKALRRCRVRPFWGGLVVVLAAELTRWYGLTRVFGSAERYAFVLSIAGLVLWVFGTRVFRRSFWLLAFLVLMAPLPGKVHNLIAGPLQSWSTTGATGSLEFLGVSVVREGNTMVLNGTMPLAVAEACSGLRMMTAFIVVAGALAFVVHRPRWQKAALVMSSIPIAILCNLIRLVVTALLFLTFSSVTAERFFHDFAGLVMMPMAFVMLLGELWVMKRLELPDAEPVPPEPGTPQAGAADPDARKPMPSAL